MRDRFTVSARRRRRARGDGRPGARRRPALAGGRPHHPGQADAHDPRVRLEAGPASRSACPTAWRPGATAAPPGSPPSTGRWSCRSDPAARARLAATASRWLVQRIRETYSQVRVAGRRADTVDGRHAVTDVRPGQQRGQGAAALRRGRGRREAADLRADRVHLVELRPAAGGAGRQRAGRLVPRAAPPPLRSSSRTTESTTATRSPPVRSATARCRWYDAPPRVISSTERSSSTHPSRAATGSSRVSRSSRSSVTSRSLRVGVEDDLGVDAVAGGAPLVLLHVPRRHGRQRLAGREPVGQVDDQAVGQRGERGELAEVGDPVADPHLDGAERGAGRTSHRISAR